MSLSSIVTAVETLLGKVPASVVGTVAGKQITWADLETSTTSIASFFTAISAAIKAKNAVGAAELTVEEALTIAADLGFGEPFTGILKTVFPLIVTAINNPGQALALASLLPGSLANNAGEAQGQIASNRFGR